MPISGEEQGSGAGLAPARQPLPPEMPPAGPAADPHQPLPPEMPGTQPAADSPPVRQPLPPEAGAPPAPAPPDPHQPLPPEMPAHPDPHQPLPPEMPAHPDDEPSGREWWRTTDMRDELRDTWAEHGREGLQAAAEIGAAIGQAVAAHLPDPYAAAQQRGLDLRWLRLGVNVPALALSLLVTWGGASVEARMAHYVEHAGLFAPLGWVLLPALVLAVLMVLPFGGVLGAAAGGLVSAAARGVVVLFRRAWGVAYLGYALRVAVAVAVWGFTIAAGRLFGHIAITWLTGVSS